MGEWGKGGGRLKARKTLALTRTQTDTLVMTAETHFGRVAPSEVGPAPRNADQQKTNAIHSFNPGLPDSTRFGKNGRMEKRGSYS